MQAQALNNTTRIATLGLIDGYDPTTHCVKVNYKPDNVISGWLPLGVMLSGNGFGCLMPPQLGDQVIVLHERGSLDAGVVVARLFNAVEAPPNVPAGEIWIVHASGAVFKMTNDGKITLGDTSGSQIQFGNNGTINITGTVNITGALTATGEGTFKGHTVSAHKHGGVQSGSSQTQTPTG
jgi:phage baseplate assembly protein V